MKKFLHDFKEFALRGNVMELAVGIIIGAAFKDIVTSFTDNLIRPILRFITSFGYVNYTWYEVSGFFTNFLTAVINFVFMALVLFLIINGVNYILKLGKKKDETPAAPTTKTCPFCKSEIHIEASRCPHCTAEQPKE